MTALVIGYGNPLRGDDGVGWHVANALAADPRAAGLTVIAAHQLMPEHAEDIHRARIAILVDAKVAALDSEGDRAVPLPPGHTTVSRIDPGPAAPPTGAWSHHCTPPALAMMARDLYGSAAPIIVVGVGVSSVAAGERLTPQVARAVPSIVDLVLRLAGSAALPPSMPTPTGECPLAEEPFHA